MQKRRWFIGACILILAVGAHVTGQSSSIIAYGFTSPVLALPGSIVSVCAFDWLTSPFAAGPVTVTEQVIDVPLNGAVAQQSMTLPISAIAPNQPTVCVQHTIPATAMSPAGPGELVAGAVILYPPPTAGAPPALFTASLNVSSSNSAQSVPIPIQSLTTGFGSANRTFR